MSTCQRRLIRKLKARVVRLMAQHGQECPSAAAEAVAKQLGIGRESVRRWSLQADVDAGRREGASSEELAEIKKLKSESRQLREDVAIVKAATTFFAGELDPRNR